MRRGSGACNCSKMSVARRFLQWQRCSELHAIGDGSNVVGHNSHGGSLIEQPGASR